MASYHVFCISESVFESLNGSYPLSTSRCLLRLQRPRESCEMPRITTCLCKSYCMPPVLHHLLPDAAQLFCSSQVSHAGDGKRQNRTRNLHSLFHCSWGGFLHTGVEISKMALLIHLSFIRCTPQTFNMQAFSSLLGR